VTWAEEEEEEEEDVERERRRGARAFSSERCGSKRVRYAHPEPGHVCHLAAAADPGLLSVDGARARAAPPPPAHNYRVSVAL